MYKLKLSMGIAMYTFEEATINKDYAGLLDEMKRCGFDSVDVGFCSLYVRDEILKGHALIREGLSMVHERGLSINAIHLPFGPYRDYSALDEEYRKQLIEDTIEMIRICDEFNPYCYVIHGSGREPIYGKEREESMAALHDSLRKLSPATKNLICVENLPRMCLLNTIEEHRQAMDGVKECENIKLCADVNHYLQDLAEVAIETLGDRIKTLHISDHDYIDERHFMPKEGKIDWMKLLSALEKTGYNGTFAYELGRSPEDIRKNYDELFAEYEEYKKKNS